MSKSNANRKFQGQPIWGRVPREEFVGREDALEEIASLTASDAKVRGLLLLSPPAAGASELLRQAYDQLFYEQGEAIPIYFSLSRSGLKASDTALNFLHNYLLQVIAFRRHDPLFSDTSLTLRDLLEQAAPHDYDWMERLIQAAEREHSSRNEGALIRLCLSAPRRGSRHGVRSLVMLDEAHLAAQFGDEISLMGEITRALARSDIPFVIAGLRRQLLDLVGSARDGLVGSADTLRLEELNDADARTLVENLARRMEVFINEEARDLIVQQFGGHLHFITALVQSARDTSTSLNSFLNCQQLYVDELLGGRINRYFNSLLEDIAPQPAARRAVVRALYESAASSTGKSSLEIWRKKTGLEADQFSIMMRALHVHELVSINLNSVEVTERSSVWRDYLRVNYRMEVIAEPRALVVADALFDALKRAPQTMARHYRRAASIGLRELLARFNCQRVPASLLHHDRFTQAYKKLDVDRIADNLDAETDLIRLPQIVHTDACVSFYPPAQSFCDEERCAVAHGFDAGNYSDAHEVIWLAAEIESKLEVGRGITEVWHDRLMQVARACNFKRVRLWLIAPEGFSVEADELLTEREVYSSNHRQLELLTARIRSDSLPTGKDEGAPNEFELIIPMGDDTELIAANTVDQIARRLAFPPEAINQIKTALVEACINATEHSLSPNQKIYQHFRVEHDRLVVTVSSRGVLPPLINNLNSESGSNSNNSHEINNQKKGRRGWGLKLIRTLMDEVEFERVDDGTRLRMTKYLRKS